ncbi:MAG: hypothetical protein HND42_08230 [Armatimonadetes bacterium]|nr:MAG: hypothetical protein EDM73_10600 [Armatimonadota bacterium]MCE7899449.1 hypothetical protein [Armatimonadetes bacterium ATM1]MDL1929200.1 hypothetical protein [Fimbriimonadia bacterium ATM]MBC6970584.1 hypothetical protein [Armatimonadota bacterium]MBL1150179.1 hypothetical protein [Armatimonadota bacterium]
MAAILSTKRRRFKSLEAIADRLLVGSGRDRSAPAYSEACLARKARRTASARKRAGDGLQSPRPTEESLAILVRAIWRAAGLAGLTRHQGEVFCARASGETWPEIARRLGHSKQAAHQAFAQAARKIRRVLRDSPFRGLEAVYHEEVYRFSPRRVARRRS